MDSPEDEGYSTLEAVPIPPDPPKKALPENSEKQIVQEYGHDSAKEAVFDHDKQLATEDHGIDPKIEDVYPTPRPRRFQRKWVIIGGTITVLAILAAVVGGVLGSQLKSKSVGLSSALPSNTTGHNIAAVSFAVNGFNNTRVYYQNQAGQILEAASSVFNGTWTNRNLGFVAKNGSAIAAAVSRPGFPPVCFTTHLWSY